MNYERFINPQISSVPPSGIRRFFDMATTVRDAISLGVGEPDFHTPYHIRNAAINSLVDGETQYTANRGLPALRQEIGLYLLGRYGVEYNPETDMVVTIGASEAIDIALRVLLCPGDEALVPEPSYVSYSPSVLFAGGVPVPVKTRQEDEFRLTAAALEAALTPRTKVLILPYPNNPTGAIMPRESLEQVADFVRRHDLMVVTDEIYSELTYTSTPHVSFAALPGMWERAVLINGFSKAFAMTGWRIGYACGPREVIAQINKVHQYSIMCAPRPSQVAACEALRWNREHDYEDVARMRESYNHRRRLMVDGFRRMGLECFEPLGAFYVFPSIRSTGLGSEAFCLGLLEKTAVACVPGTAFGASGEGHIRCSYATGVDKLTLALERMDSYINSLPTT